MFLTVYQAIYDHYVLSAVVLVWSVVWIYSKLQRGVCSSKASLDGKTVIITGCDSGLGKATAFDIARRGARVIMACINLPLAHQVRESIVKETKNDNVVVRMVDMSRMKSVREFAEEINRTENRLDVLIHNAGVLNPPQHATEKGINMTWAVNYFGPFLLTHLLIDLLKGTAKSRIVFVSSIAHLCGKVDPSNPNRLDDGFLAAYSGSKLAIAMFATELARRLEATGVTSNFLHPGIIYTPILGNQPLVLRLLLPLLVPFLKSVEQGAQTCIYLAVSEEVEGISGKYFSNCKVDVPAKLVTDADLAKKFWEVSKEVVEMTPTDPQI